MGARLGITVALAAAVLAPPPAGAQPRPPANPHEVQAKKLLGKKKYDAAIAEFKLADAATPDARFDCNIAIAYSEAGKPAQARFFLDRCRDRTNGVIPPAHVKLVANHEARINAALTKGEFGRVEFTVTPAGATVRVDPFLEDEKLETPVKWTIWIPAGSQAYEVAAAGMQPVTGAVVIVSGEEAHVTLTMTPIATAEVTEDATDGGDTTGDPTDDGHTDTTTTVTEPARDPDAGGAGNGGLGDPVSAPIERDLPPPSRGPAPWISLAVGAVGLAVGVIFTIKALDTRDQAGRAGNDDEYDRLVDRMRTENIVFDVGYAVGAVGIGVGIYLLLRAPGETARPRGSTPTVDVGPGSVGVRWTF